MICSVVPEKAELLRKVLKGIELHEVSYRSKLGVGIDYPKPKSIGADRLANAASAATNGSGQRPTVAPAGSRHSRGCQANGAISRSMSATVASASPDRSQR